MDAVVGTMRRFGSHSLALVRAEAAAALLSSPRFCIDPKASSLNTLTVPPKKRHKHFITVSRGYFPRGSGAEFVVCCV